MKFTYTCKKVSLNDSVKAYAEKKIGIGLDGVVQGDFLAGKCELHNGSLLSISASRESKKEVSADSLFTFTDYSTKRENSQ